MKVSTVMPIIVTSIKMNTAGSGAGVVGGCVVGTGVVEMRFEGDGFGVAEGDVAEDVH